MPPLLGGIVDLVVAEDRVSFAPVQTLHVETRAFVFDDGFLSGFFHEFEVVPIPEPATGTLLALGIAVLAWGRRTAG